MSSIFRASSSSTFVIISVFQDGFFEDCCIKATAHTKRACDTNARDNHYDEQIIRFLICAVALVMRDLTHFVCMRRHDKRPSNNQNQPLNGHQGLFSIWYLDITDCNRCHISRPAGQRENAGRQAMQPVSCAASFSAGRQKSTVTDTASCPVGGPRKLRDGSVLLSFWTNVSGHLDSCSSRRQ